MVLIKKAPHQVELPNIVCYSLVSYKRSSSTKITIACLQQQQQVLYADAWVILIF
jgi:hypothetical protein